MVSKSLVAGGGISNSGLIRKQPAELRELYKWLRQCGQGLMEKEAGKLR